MDWQACRPQAATRWTAPKSSSAARATLPLQMSGQRGQPWPIPFDPTPVLAHRGQPTVVLASGDPFWFGAGGSLMAHLQPGEWTSHPAPSTFQLAANRLGWRLEEVLTLGLHAAPFARLRPVLGRAFA
jgi:precorrin-6Y C5,15-methyltransferase (decarboxylating)